MSAERISTCRMCAWQPNTWICGNQLIGNRKSPIKQAKIIGFGTLFALFTRRLTLDDAIKRVCERIGIQGRAIVWPYAEACMDVDKPHQLELMRDRPGETAASGSASKEEVSPQTGD